jgi:dGTPase
MVSGGESRDQLEKREIEELKCYALRSAERRKALADRFRQYDRKDDPLEFRTEYHRDRDRIVWSTAFRRLQHKTQIFPHYVEDHYQRRLTHSLEVAQISTTLCRALELNEVAAEAISLGHDIGHTPFGHGGEEALDTALQCLAKEDGVGISSTPVAVYGFDHCVQGVEQVSRICDDYKPQYYGLNLSFDVRDGILKHIYDQDPIGATKSARHFSNLSRIVKLDEYKQFAGGHGSLEAQCVWFADKVAYLLSDMEDGLRAQIFSFGKIEKDPFVKSLWENYKKWRPTESGTVKIATMDEFLSFKRKALSVLILDCAKETSERLDGFNPKSVDDVLKNGRIVNVRPDLRSAWKGFYAEKQRDTLYCHEGVKACEFKAAKIVGDLFGAYRNELKLIPAEFREDTQKAYEHLLERKCVDVMIARNYVAGMTDSFAIEQHKRLFMSSERANVF